MTLVTRCALLAAFMLGIGVVALTTTSPGHALGFGNSAQCLSALVSAPPQGVDSLIIGSSRTRRGITPEMVGELTGRGEGAFANLGHPTTSLAFDYAVIDRLSRQRQLDLVLVEIQPRGPKLAKAERELDPSDMAPIPLISGNYDHLFALGTDYGSAFRLVDRQSSGAASARWDKAQLVAQRLGRSLTLLVNGEARKTFRRNEGMDWSRDTICFMKNWGSEADEFQHGNEGARRLRETYIAAFDPDTPFDQEDPADFFTAEETRLQRDLIRAIVELGNERGFTAAFFYLPGIRIPVDKEMVGSRFEDEFGRPIFIPDRATRAAMEDGGYYDNSHLNNHGRAVYSSWLAESILQRSYLPL